MKKIRINTLEFITCLLLIVYSTLFYVFSVPFHVIIKEPVGLFYTFRNSISFFAVFFAIGETVSYIRNFRYKDIDKRDSGCLLFFIMPFTSIVLIGFYFSLFRFFGQPFLTNTLLIVVGLIFGISYRSELIDESIVLKVKKKSLLTESKFNHSLADNFYYFLVIIFFIYPIEYYCQLFFNDNFLYIVFTYPVLIYLWYKVSTLLSHSNIFNLEISDENNIQTTVLVMILCFLSLFGLIVWDITALNNPLVDDTFLQKLMYLVFVGIIPIRTIPIFFSKTSLLIRLFILCSLIYYVFAKCYYYQWNIF